MATTRNAYIITGPTSGMGRTTAFELAGHGTVVLVGRNRGKLDEVQQAIEKKGGHATSVVCDLSDITSARAAAAQVATLGLPLAGLVNNAGILERHATKSAQGWDRTFATNHLGPFAFTEALIPHLPDGASVLFVCSAVEDLGRKPAVMAGFRGARFISVEASARGEWTPGGSKLPGGDAYATSKQCNLATAQALSRELPRLRVNAIEPGFNPSTGLGADAGAFVRFLQRYIVPLLVPLLLPFIKILTTSRRAGRVITRAVLNPSNETGIYYDEGGQPMRGSALVHDPAFQDRVVAETRAFLAAMTTEHATG